MRVSYTLLAFYLICLSVTVQRRDVLTQEWQEFPSVAFKDLSKDQQTYIILFLTHVVVAVWILIYVYGTDMVYWNQSSSRETECKQCHSNTEIGSMNVAEMLSNTEHLKNDNEEWHEVEVQPSADREQSKNDDEEWNEVEMQASADREQSKNDNEEWHEVEMQATEQFATDHDDEELNESYLSILVDCIRVMISQAANERQARSIIHKALSEEFPKYFHNDKVIDCLLAMSNNLSNGLLESKVTEAAGVSAGEQNEDKNLFLVEDVVASQEEDDEYVSAITDEELISMISDILSNSCETAEDYGAPYFPLEEHDVSKTLSHRPVSPMDKEEDQSHEQGNTDEDGSVEMSSSVHLLDQMHFLSGSASEGSYLESTDSQRGSVFPLRKEDLDDNFSWPSLPAKSRVLPENEFDRDTDPFSTFPRYAFSTPTCVITTSSCQSCKDAEQELQSIELTPARFLPTTARLSLSGSSRDSFSEVLSELTQAKRSGYKGKPATARELWSDNQEEKDTSIFNTSFSISSLENLLSPQSIPPSPSSPVFGSPEKSPNLLGIRLHKPAGFKDIFLSIVDHDKKTSLLRNISDTWTLGTKEEMELILHVDTNPHQCATKTYSGSYCLVFNDKSDLEEYFSNEDSQEEFSFSMLCNDDNSREERVCTSDEEYYECFLSSTNVDGVTCEEDQEIVLKISQENELGKSSIIALESKEEKHQEEEELPQNEKSDHDNIKANGSKGEKRPEEELPHDEKCDHDQSHSAEKLHEDSSRDKERIFTFACLALASYLVHRYLK